VSWLRQESSCLKAREVSESKKFLFESQYITRCKTCTAWKYDKLLQRDEFSNSREEEEDDLTYCVERLRRWIKNSVNVKLPNSVEQIVSQLASFRRTKNVHVDSIVEKLIELKVISLGDESNNYFLKYF